MLGAHFKNIFKNKINVWKKSSGTKGFLKFKQRTQTK